MRHNLACALVRLLGGASIADLLADRDGVTASDAAAAARALSGDGIDIHSPAAGLQLLPVLPYLPDLDDW